MPRNRLSALTSATYLGVEAGALTAVGLQLPVDFFGHLSSVLMYMRPLQLIPFYSAAWLAYLILGGLAGGLMAFAAAGVLVLFRRDSRETVRSLTLWITAVVTVAVLFWGFRAYLEGTFLNRLRSSMGRGFAVANVMFVLGLSFWLVARHRPIISRLRGFLTAIALCGSLAVGGTVLMASWHAVASQHDTTHSMAGSNPRPPVILITVDALAANHMSLYGYHRETTPSLERLARQSVVFEGHHSNANLTTTSISSILNGVRPWVHRAFQLSASPLPGIAQFGLLPAAQHAGYRTLVVTTNVWASPDHQSCAAWVTRQSHGIGDVVNWMLYRFPQLDPVLFLRSMQQLYTLIEGFTASRDTQNLEYDPERAFSKARSMLSGMRDQKAPSFLWVHLLPPHDPYASPAPFLKTFEPDPRAQKWTDSTPPFGYVPAGSDFPGPFLGRYDEAVLYVDHHIGGFLDWLREQGLFDDALIIVTADHGESFSHGYGGHGGPMLHEDLIHVPLLVKLPHQQEGRRVAAVLTEHADLLPTVLDYLGEPAPKHVEGRSLKAALEGATLEPRPVYSMDFEQNSVFLPLKTGSVAMLDGHYKYVTYFGEIRYPFMPKLEDALYDLEADPGETRNLIPEAPERAAKMRSAIQAQLSAHSLPVQ